VPAADGLGLEVLWALMPASGYAPDFLCPPPTHGPTATFAAEVARVRATDPAVAAAEIARSLADGPGPRGSGAVAALTADPAAAVQALADALTRAWEALVAPHWPRLRGLLEADVVFHARRLAEGGLARLFAELHPQVSWSGGTLSVGRADVRPRRLSGQGVTLVPSAFVWPDVVSGFEDPWQPTVIYPARGVGALWSAPAAGDVPEALSRLLGARRAAVLTALAEPASTSVLAERLGLAPSSVSAHLAALRDAGLLTSCRLRHEVLYERTPLGAALASGGQDR
jgi:DNA-binding transcriptional ArsR family regulator